MALPTVIHSIRAGVTEFEEHQGNYRRSVFGFPKQAFEVHKQEVVMHLSVSSKKGRLPKRFPVGTTYVVEGCGGGDGHLHVFSRYVVLPGGTRINLGADNADNVGANFAGPASPRNRGRARNRSESQSQRRGKRHSARAKKIMARRGTGRQRRR